MMRHGMAVLDFPTQPVERTSLDRDIGTGARLAEQQGATMQLLPVIKALNATGAKYVLVGAHAINGYTGKPRATVDVDVVAQYPKKVASALQQAFPLLTSMDTPVVIRLLLDGKEAIDVIKPESSKVFREALRNIVRTQMGGLSIPVPDLETVLALKFSSMISLTRKPADRLIDAGDFIHIVEANVKIDLKKLHSLGELVFAGGGDEILQHVTDARAGRTIRI